MKSRRAAQVALVLTMGCILQMMSMAVGRKCPRTLGLRALDLLDRETWTINDDYSLDELLNEEDFAVISSLYISKIEVDR